MARSDRKSSQLEAYQGDKIWRARLHAEQIGKPLNAFLTINWDNQSGTGTVQERNARLRTCARRWLDRRRKQKLTAVWVIERGPGGSLHAHNLIHVPRHLLAGFTGMLPQWTGVPALPKEKWPPEKRKQHVLGYGEDGIWHFERLYDHGTRVMRYMLKGCPYLWHSHGVQYHDQGVVIGQRCGNTQNLGEAARDHYQPPAAAA